MSDKDNPAEAGLDKSVQSPPPKVADKRPIEAWREDKKTPDWLFAATKYGAFHNAEGWECTEAQYDAACELTRKAPIGGPGKPHAIKTRGKQ